jgi:hypothetical protein
MKNAIIVFSEPGDSFLCVLKLPRYIEDLPEAIDSVMDKLLSDEFAEQIVEQDGRELDIEEPYRITSCYHECGNLFLKFQDGTKLEKLVDLVKIM